MVDEIMSRGLLAELGLRSDIVRSVILDKDGDAAHHGADVEGALGPWGVLGPLAARLGLVQPHHEASRELLTSGGHAAVHVERGGAGGGRITLYKPLGLSLSAPF